MPTPPDLYAHERIARWKGWSLVAERPGKSGVGSGTELQDGGEQPGPADRARRGRPPPLLSVTFAAPTTAGRLLPKLRFGDLYRFRARAADLAGNGVEVTSPDASTATSPTPHLRFEPVESPQLAAIKPPAPGEGTQLMVILDDQVNPVPPNGRWVFAPKVSELMAEEHGMLDGFVEGPPPDPAASRRAVRRPRSSSSPRRDPARLNDVPGVAFYGANFNSTGSPNVGTPYFPGATKLAVPWIPDPLSAGVAMVGVPGTTRIRSSGSGKAAAGPIPSPSCSSSRPERHQARATRPAPRRTRRSRRSPSRRARPPKWRCRAHSSPGALGPAGRLLGLLRPRAVAVAGRFGHQSKTARRARASPPRDGLLWQLSPSRILTLIHAVRLPLLAPTFGTPETRRGLGSTKAELDRPEVRRRHQEHLQPRLPRHLGRSGRRHRQARARPPAHRQTPSS